MLDFRMETFLAVCETMNFTRAAQKLHITQPAVSQHIHFLEESYGVRLFEYKGRKLKMTGQGKLLFNAAETMKHDEMYLRKRLTGSLTGGKRLVFGATLTAGAFVMPGPVSAYMKRHPDTQIKMAVANTRELLSRLDHGTIDFAVVEGFFEKSRYDYLEFAKENYIAVCGRDYKLQKEARRIEDLLEECLLLRERGSGTLDILVRYLEGRNMTLRDFKLLHEISSMDAIKSLAVSGCGITFLYEAAVKEELRNGDLRALTLEDFPLVHDFSFIWRADSIFSEDYRELFEALKPGF